METLANTPNLLFLIAVRYDTNSSGEIPSFMKNMIWKDWSPFTKLLIIPKLRRPDFHRKFLKAITTRYLVHAESISVPEHGIVVEENDILYMVNGKFHREDGPAVTGPHGDMYCINHQKHRVGPNGESLPAVKFMSGEEYWIDGKRTRTDGGWAHHDAIGTPNECYCWFKDGELHRDGLPAVEFLNGSRFYYVTGIRHREDGPALIKPITDDDPFKQEQWWLNGERHRIGGAATIISDETGIIERSWYVNGKLHRENGPAIEHGTNIDTPEEQITEYHWFLNDVRHRIGGPAAFGELGYELWMINGKKHRTDGPALRTNDGIETWYLEDMEVTRETVEMLYPSESNIFV